MPIQTVASNCFQFEFAVDFLCNYPELLPLLQALDAFDGDTFVILFKDDKGTKFKGLYVLSGDGKEVTALFFFGSLLLLRIRLALSYESWLVCYLDDLLRRVKLG